jgi:CheY-like chemotaxis protein
MTDTVLIVDDEESVRRTFQEWLASAGPDVVAILVTGFAHQATPLDALRMGVRDYLDKSTDLNRETFLAAVRRQLDRIRPAKRQRELNRSLSEFREAVEKVLPIVRTSAAFNDPVPLPDAVRSLLRFLMRAVEAADGALIVRHMTPEGEESIAAYGADGEQLPTPELPFNRSLAATVVSFQEPVAVNAFDPGSFGAVELLPFERGRKSLLAAPLPVGGGTAVVLELFDKPAPGFTEDDRRLVAAGAEIGADLLRQAVSERQTHRLLFDAVDAALKASSSFTEAIGPDPRLEEPPPPAVMERLRQGLDSDANAVVDADTTLKLVEAVRGLAVRHGPAAVEHCSRMVNDLRRLLDGLTGTV